MTPGAQHEEDRIHCRTVRHARVVTAQRVPRPWRQKRLHLCPQSVRQAPAIIANPPSGLPQSILLGHVLNMAMAALAAYWDTLLAGIASCLAGCARPSCTAVQSEDLGGCLPGHLGRKRAAIR